MGSKRSSAASDACKCGELSPHVYLAHRLDRRSQDAGVKVVAVPLERFHYSRAFQTHAGR
jgi:hypothetical protein